MTGSGLPATLSPSEDDREPTVRRLDPAAASSFPFSDSESPRPPHRASRAWWFPPLLLLIAGGGVGYYLWRQYATPPAVPPAAPALAPAPTPAPATEDNAIRHPIEEVPTEATPPAPLPSLAESDAAVQDALGGLVRGDTARVFRLEDMIHRFVATIDNLARDSAAPRLMPIQPVPGAFVAAGREGSLVIGAENANRYVPYVRLLESVDTQKLVATYVHFYPLFQQAYERLGYPKGYFNDRLIATIDLLLAAPEPTGVVRLAQPKVLYEFADPNLEALPAGQKMMVRMGLANEARVKTKLREIRKALTAKRPTP
jgi:hypothetical protein